MEEATGCFKVSWQTGAEGRARDGGGQGWEAAWGRRALWVETHGVCLYPKCTHAHHSPGLLLGACLWSQSFSLAHQTRSQAGMQAERASLGESAPLPTFLCCRGVTCQLVAWQNLLLGQFLTDWLQTAP